MAATNRLPPAKRRYTFAMTPLADAMFQLLIFFMLTSSLTPYSLLTINAGQGSPAEEIPQEEPEPAEPSEEADPAATWTIENGAVIAGGQRFNFDTLPGLAQVLGQREAPSVVLISTEKARVQDIVTVLETLAAADIRSVQIVSLVER